MSRRQKKKKKKIAQIVVLSILCTIIVVLSVLYFYPRTILFIHVKEKVREIGNPQQFQITGGYMGDSDWLDTDWLSANIPLEYGMIDEAEISEDESGAYYSGSGLNVFISRRGVLADNEYIEEGDRESYLGADSINKYTVMMYKTAYELPSVLQLAYIEDIEAQFDKHFDFYEFFDNNRYSYYEKDGYGYTILNTEPEGTNLYTIKVYDLANYNLVGEITLSYDIGASRDLAVEDMGVKLLIDSIIYYSE